jgi:hypothetical protein
MHSLTMFHSLPVVLLDLLDSLQHSGALEPQGVHLHLRVLFLPLVHSHEMVLFRVVIQLFDDSVSLDDTIRGSWLAFMKGCSPTIGLNLD